MILSNKWRCICYWRKLEMIQQFFFVSSRFKPILNMTSKTMTACLFPNDTTTLSACCMFLNMRIYCGYQGGVSMSKPSSFNEAQHEPMSRITHGDHRHWQHLMRYVATGVTTLVVCAMVKCRWYDTLIWCDVILMSWLTEITETHCSLSLPSAKCVWRPCVSCKPNLPAEKPARFIFSKCIQNRQECYGMIPWIAILKIHDDFMLSSYSSYFIFQNQWE